MQAMLVQHRTSARAAAGELCRRRARQAARHHRPPPPKPLAELSTNEGALRRNARPMMPRRPRSAPQLASPQTEMTPWRFFACKRHFDESANENSMLVWPAAPSSYDVSEDFSNVGVAKGSGPPIVLARPCTSELLQHGPFAFKLSPSSEVLAWLVGGALRASFRGKRVLELGSGLGYTGIACAAWTDCASVLITDGDPTSVGALQRNVSLNASSAFGTTSVAAHELRYGDGVAEPGAEGGRQLFDCILCADCVYDRAFHLPLLTTIRRCLNPAGGRCYVAASRRCGSLDDFLRCASAQLLVEALPADAPVVARFRGQKCFPFVFCLRPPP